MSKVKTAYYCQNCGFQSLKWMGKCPSCGEWNTLVEEIVNKALENVLIKVKEYVQKGKITEYEFDIFKKTLYEIAIDLKDGGINRGLHKYFLDHYTEINFEIYKEKYQYKLEYFFKLLKENIIQLLK